MKIGRKNGNILDRKGDKTGLKPDTLQSINCRYGRAYEEKGMGETESEKIYTLMYTDDVALMAEEEQDRDR